MDGERIAAKTPSATPATIVTLSSSIMPTATATAMARQASAAGPLVSGVGRASSRARRSRRRPTQAGHSRRLEPQGQLRADDQQPHANHRAEAGKVEGQGVRQGEQNDQHAMPMLAERGDQFANSQRLVWPGTQHDRNKFRDRKRMASGYRGMRHVVQAVYVEASLVAFIRMVGRLRYPGACVACGEAHRQGRVHGNVNVA